MMLTEENLEVGFGLKFLLQFRLQLILQALHKIVRKIRESKARLQNNELNLTDILTRLCSEWTWVL